MYGGEQKIAAVPQGLHWKCGDYVAIMLDGILGPGCYDLLGVHAWILFACFEDTVVVVEEV